jgi:hypothetical protein
MSRLAQLAKILCRVAREEDRDLRSLGRSIFFVPEVAFAYLAGKALARDFANDSEWVREQSLDEKLGPSDLILRPKSPTSIKPTVIEFKAYDAPSTKIKDDVRKLRQISSEYDRLFCVFMNPSGHSLDKHLHIKTVEKESGEPVPVRVYDFASKEYAFETVERDKSSGSCWWCVVGLWQIV